MVSIVRLTLLNHLFYYTESSGGGVSSARTGAFIGDLALTYAFANALCERDDAYPWLETPRYTDDLRVFGFYCTVARPLDEPPLHTNVFTQNTLFTDGYPDLDNTTLSAKSPYKNLRRVQGITAGSQFVAALFSSKPIDLPPCVRVGRARETLVHVESASEIDVGGSDFWLNAFTLKTVFSNLDRAVSLSVQNRKVHFEHLMEQYFLLKNLSLAEVRDIFQPIFP